eukprot:1147849-Pelagomonas_calceolata.AAC.5
MQDGRLGRVRSSTAHHALHPVGKPCTTACLSEGSKEGQMSEDRKVTMKDRKVTMKEAFRRDNEGGLQA